MSESPSLPFLVSLLCCVSVSADLELIALPPIPSRKAQAMHQLERHLSNMFMHLDIFEPPREILDTWDNFVVKQTRNDLEKI